MRSLIIKRIVIATTAAINLGKNNKRARHHAVTQWRLSQTIARMPHRFILIASCPFSTFSFNGKASTTGISSISSPAETQPGLIACKPFSSFAKTADTLREPEPDLHLAAWLLNCGSCNDSTSSGLSSAEAICTALSTDPTLTFFSFTLPAPPASAWTETTSSKALRPAVCCPLGAVLRRCRRGTGSWASPRSASMR